MRWSTEMWDGSRPRIGSGKAGLKGRSEEHLILGKSGWCRSPFASHHGTDPVSAGVKQSRRAPSCITRLPTAPSFEVGEFMPSLRKEYQDFSTHPCWSLSKPRHRTNCLENGRRGRVQRSEAQAGEQIFSASGRVVREACIKHGGALK